MMKIEFGEAVDDGNGHWVVPRTVTYDDETKQEGVHIFPKDALEWRAAEYGIDPNDRATLLDIILAEPYLDAADPKRTLYAASSQEDARKHHMDRVVSAKLRNRMTTRGRDHPLNPVREQSPISNESLQDKQKLVRQQRIEIAQQSKVEDS